MPKKFGGGRYLRLATFGG